MVGVIHGSFPVSYYNMWSEAHTWWLSIPLSVVIRLHTAGTSGHSVTISEMLVNT